MDQLEMYLVYFAYNLVLLGPLAALLVFAVRRAHRVCKSRAWPRYLALGFALLFGACCLVPFAVFDASWATFWYVLAAPFSVVLEFNVAFGFALFCGLVTIVAASFWSSLLYVVTALLLRMKDAWAQRGVPTNLSHSDLPE